MKQVTLTDVAARLGISKYSVSRALSGRSGVSEGTRRKVFDAARELGYRHAALARPRLEAGRQSIVLLIPRHDVEDPEFWMGLISGASREAEALGYTFVTRPLERAGTDVPAPRSEVAGVIVAGSRARSALAPYLEAGVPASLVTYPEPLEPCDAVHSADFEGGAIVASHLVGLGHTHLAYVTEAPEKPSFAARARGFRETALQLAGIEIEEIHIDPNEPGLSFEGAFRRLAERGHGPTGILSSTDGLAFTVAWALGRIGLDVPSDVSLVGFNDAVESARFVPKLTTLRIPTEELGASAMRFLHERVVALDDRSPARRLQLIPTFVLRESTAPPRVTAITRGSHEAGTGERVDT